MQRVGADRGQVLDLERTDNTVRTNSVEEDVVVVATAGYTRGFAVLCYCVARVVVGRTRSAYRQDQVLGYKKTTSARKG